jgi:hypothetical protein
MYSNIAFAMNEEKKLLEQISVMEDQHRELDKKINEAATLNMIEVQRLKKQKLFLKDQIAILKSNMLPDAIA